MESKETKKRVRRTAEQRLADLERKKQEILERQQAALAKIEEQKRRLTQNPVLRKEKVENQKRFYRALAVVAPEWEEAQVIAAVEKCLSENPEELANRGAELLEQHGKPRRGRKPKRV